MTRVVVLTSDQRDACATYAARDIAGARYALEQARAFRAMHSARLGDGLPSAMARSWVRDASHLRRRAAMYRLLSRTGRAPIGSSWDQPGAQHSD